jgi:hypothetical protein
MQVVNPVLGDDLGAGGSLIDVEDEHIGLALSDRSLPAPAFPSVLHQLLRAHLVQHTLLGLGVLLHHPFGELGMKRPLHPGSIGSVPALDVVQRR